MTIVLPHGVLFRGGEEEKIRKNLIEYNHIDAIIGLPANIFFGTGIPTIIIVLRQERERNDVLMIDASKHFIKVGKNNHLQASDIKRIVDCVTHRRELPKFSRIVPKAEIVANGYNLNIPRYVDSAEPTEHGIFSPPYTAAFPKQSWHNSQTTGQPLTVYRRPYLPITAHLMCSRKPTISKLPCKATPAC